MNGLAADSPLTNAQKSMLVMEMVERTSSLFYPFGILLHVNGKPFINGAPEMVKAMFDCGVPRIRVMKCGRQVGKSTTQSAEAQAYSAALPYFNTLFVTPQYIMTNRFSKNYYQPMLEKSPIAELVLDRSCDRNEMQRTMNNGSITHFSYAGDAADRVRGIPGDKVIVDEAQDVSRAIVDELYQVTGASQYRLLNLSGTPKTLDGTLEWYWQKSSRSEWIIKCPHAGCHFENIPSIDHHALKMIGDHTLICARCGKPITADSGRWVPSSPGKMADSVGWHIPQIILPRHYANPSNWGIIVRAMKGEIAPHLFWNEIMGESFDLGAKLITLPELQAASTLERSFEWRKAAKGLSQYTVRICGVDWGGRGSDDVSRTKICVIGLTPEGVCETIYADDLSRMPGPDAEVLQVVEVAKHLKCQFISHDTAGTAGTRDVMLIAAGWRPEGLLPMSYTAPWGASLITAHDANERSNRFFYSVNKAKAIAAVCSYVKYGFIKFPKWDIVERYATDFLALIEERTYNGRSGDQYIINRSADLCDDWVHALTFAVLGAYHMTGHYPSLSKAMLEKFGAYKGSPEEDEEVEKL